MSVGDVVVFVLVVVAAAVGAALRFVIGSRFNREFPTGTLLVNLVAAAGLGFVVAAADPLPTIVGIGGLGALSTWSAAANEAGAMSRDGHGRLGLAYLALTVSTGILAAWFGLKLGIALIG